MKQTLLYEVTRYVQVSENNNEPRNFLSRAEESRLQLGRQENTFAYSHLYYLLSCPTRFESNLEQRSSERRGDFLATKPFG